MLYFLNCVSFFIIFVDFFCAISSPSTPLCLLFIFFSLRSTYRSIPLDSSSFLLACSLSLPPDFLALTFYLFPCLRAHSMLFFSFSPLIHLAMAPWLFPILFFPLLLLIPLHPQDFFFLRFLASSFIARCSFTNPRSRWRTPGSLVKCCVFFLFHSSPGRYPGVSQSHGKSNQVFCIPKNFAACAVLIHICTLSTIMNFRYVPICPINPVYFHAQNNSRVGNACDMFGSED